MRFIGLCLAALLVLHKPASAFFSFGLIKTGIEAIGKNVDAVSEEVFRKKMVAETIKIAATLQKNFDESKAFYDEMRTISQNPGVLTEYAKKQSLDRLGRSQDYAIGRAESEYVAAYNQPGYLARQHAVATKYIETNLDYTEKIRSAIRDKKKETSEIVKETPGQGDPKAEEKRNAALLRHSQMQTELLLDIAALNAQSLEALTKLYDYMSKNERSAVAREEHWRREVERLVRDRMRGEAKARKSSEEALRELLK
ncbi:MAG: hypothetical protein U0944_00330 [Candidatus Moranbacteria bacterium]|nr:hypothetical protein [Candidatus Moranbacteria bacterium]